MVLGLDTHGPGGGDRKLPSPHQECFAIALCSGGYLVLFNYTDYIKHVRSGNANICTYPGVIYNTVLLHVLYNNIHVKYNSILL